jgi:hypothetical protein
MNLRTWPTRPTLHLQNGPGRNELPNTESTFLGRAGAWLQLMCPLENPEGVAQLEQLCGLLGVGTPSQNYHPAGMTKDHESSSSSSYRWHRRCNTPTATSRISLFHVSSE